MFARRKWKFVSTFWGSVQPMMSLPHRPGRWRCRIGSTGIGAATTLTSNPASTICLRSLWKTWYINENPCLPFMCQFTRWLPQRTGMGWGRTSRWPQTLSPSELIMRRGLAFVTCISLCFISMRNFLSVSLSALQKWLRGKFACQKRVQIWVEGTGAWKLFFSTSSKL